MSDSPEHKPATSPPDRLETRLLPREVLLPYLSGILLLGTAFFVFIVYRSYIWPAFAAVLLYVGFTGLNNRLVRLLRGRRTVPAAVSTLAVITVVFGPLAVLTRQIILEGIDLVVTTKETITGDQLVVFIQRFPELTDIFTSEPFFWINLHAKIHSLAGQYGSYLDTEQLSNWVGNAYVLLLDSVQLTATVSFHLLLSLIILFFLFRDGEKFFRFLTGVLPFPKNITEKFGVRMRDILLTVLKGNVLISIVQGAAVGFGFFFVDLPNAVLYGSIAALFSVVPVIGTAVVWIPAGIYLSIFKADYGSTLFLSVYCLGAYLLLENIVKPKILDRKLGIHPVFLFFAIIGGIAEFGITGIILGPLLVTLFLTLWGIYHVYEGGEELNDDNQSSG